MNAFIEQLASQPNREDFQHHFLLFIQKLENMFASVIPQQHKYSNFSKNGAGQDTSLTSLLTPLHSVHNWNNKGMPNSSEVITGSLNQPPIFSLFTGGTSMNPCLAKQLALPDDTLWFVLFRNGSVQSQEFSRLYFLENDHGAFLLLTFDDGTLLYEHRF